VSNRRDGWPEHTYRYVTHYFWEPQHLLRTESSIGAVKATGERKEDIVYRKLRTQEVPLNYLVNILLRIVPSGLRCSALQPFGIDINDAGPRVARVENPGRM